MACQMYGAATVVCLDYEVYGSHGAELLFHRRCPEVVHGCHMFVDNDRVHFTLKMILCVPVVFWMIVRILWTTWRERSSERRLRNRKSAAMELIGLASTLKGHVGEVAPTSMLPDIDADRETQ